MLEDNAVITLNFCMFILVIECHDIAICLILIDVSYCYLLNILIDVSFLLLYRVHKVHQDRQDAQDHQDRKEQR